MDKKTTPLPILIAAAVTFVLFLFYEFFDKHPHVRTPPAIDTPAPHEDLPTPTPPVITMPPGCVETRTHDYIVAPICPRIARPRPVNVPVVDGAKREPAERKLENPLPSVALLTAKWCGACQKLEREILPELLARLHDVGYKVEVYDVDDRRDEAEQLEDPEGGSLPAIVAFRGGEGEKPVVCGRIYNPKSVPEVMSWVERVKAAPQETAKPRPACQPCPGARRWIRRR
jgi:thiol-disulfide isomerase/thioredoxin